MCDLPLKSKVLGSSFFKPLQVLCLTLTSITAQAVPTHLGDLDDDNTFTAIDLAKLVAHTSGTTLLPENLRPFADLNQDSVINDSDHSALVNLILQTAEPQTLPLASVSATSPHNGEGEVAVTRETVLRFSMPLSLDSAVDTTQLYAEFGGRKILSRVDVSGDRKKATLFYLEPLPSKARIKVTFAPVGLTDLLGRAIDPDGDGEAGGTYTCSFDTLSITGLVGTAITGRVLASEVGAGGADVPVTGATVTVDGAEETLRAVTDAQGNFTLTPCPAGSFFVHVDGRTSPMSSYPNGDYYPPVGKRWDALAGRTDNLSGNIQDTSGARSTCPRSRPAACPPSARPSILRSVFPEVSPASFPSSQAPRWTCRQILCSPMTATGTAFWASLRWMAAACPARCLLACNCRWSSPFRPMAAATLTFRCQSLFRTCRIP